MDELELPESNTPVLITPTAPTVVQNLLPKQIVVYFSKHGDMNKLWFKLYPDEKLVFGVATYFMYKDTQGIKKLPLMEIS